MKSAKDNPELLPRQTTISIFPTISATPLKKIHNPITVPISYTIDASRVGPYFLDFEAAKLAKKYLSVYRMLIFPGNHSDLVGRIAKIRGFLEVFF